MLKAPYTPEAQDVDMCLDLHSPSTEVTGHDTQWSVVSSRTKVWDYRVLAFAPTTPHDSFPSPQVPTLPRFRVAQEMLT